MKIIETRKQNSGIVEAGDVFGNDDLTKVYMVLEYKNSFDIGNIVSLIDGKVLKFNAPGLVDFINANGMKFLDVELHVK